MENNCLKCRQAVRPRQEGLECDGCQRWCHRTCGSFITRAEYRNACRNGYIDWKCELCSAVNDDEIIFEISTTPPSPSLNNTTMTNDNTNIYEQTIDDPNASDLGSFTEPQIHNETDMSIDDGPSPVFIPPEEPQPVTYSIVEGASNKSKDVLVDSLGYQYTMKVDKRRAAVTWRCHRRSKTLVCKATVLYREGAFTRGTQHHVCNAEPGRVKVLEIRKEVKKRAERRVFDSAAEITEEVFLEEIPPGQMALHPTLPKPNNVARQGNHNRRKTRPQDPQDLDFELDLDRLPEGEFLQRDIRVGTSRHIMFATLVMLDLLSKAHTWYLDGTFKVVKQPFYQLFSVHAFLKSGTSLKQVPLAFVLMSSRRADDYREVTQLLLLALFTIAMIHPEVLKDQTEVPETNPLIPQENLSCRFRFHSWIQQRTLTKEDICVAELLTVCMLIITLLLVYGAAKNRPGYLMPFFCIQVFDFCLACLAAVGSFSYMPNVKEWISCQLPTQFPMRGQLLSMDGEWLMLLVVIAFVLMLSIKAYFVGVVWSCYRFLHLAQSTCSNVRQFTVDPDTEMLLPPKYEDVIKMTNEQPPPPPYVPN